MNHSTPRRLLPFGRSSAVLAACCLGLNFHVSAAAVPGAEYQIYSGSTHAHTQFTWSHGEQWASGASENSEGAEKKETVKKKASPDGKAAPETKAAKEKKGGLRISPEGVQSPPASGILKPNWRENQGTPAEHFARAKAQGYDFYTTTDHSQEEKLNPPGADNPVWAQSQQEARAATDGRFVALVGYEHSENNGPNGSGHLNVINSGEYLNALAPGVDLPTLYKWLPQVRSAGEGPVVAVFNHPSEKQYNDWAYRDDRVTDVITMLELINSNKNLHYAGFIAALDKGWKVAPVCGNDNHGFTGIPRHTSRTFVLATGRTKSAILEAMKARRTYAAFEQNIQCRYTANGRIMGSTLERPDQLVFDIAISDPDTMEAKDRITKIDIVTEGGAVAESFEPTPSHRVTWKPTISGATKRYYFIRVWNAGGGDLATAKPDQPIAWLAPIWTGR